MVSHNREGFTWSFVFLGKFRTPTLLSTQVINGKAGWYVACRAYLIE
jgi:hypothetical protein